MSETIVIKIPKGKKRNPYTLLALLRKGGRMKDKRIKRIRNPRKSNWEEE